MTPSELIVRGKQKDPGEYAHWVKCHYRAAIGFTIPAVAGAYVYTRIISPGTGGTNAISLSATGKKFTVIP